MSLEKAAGEEGLVGCLGVPQDADGVRQRSPCSPLSLPLSSIHGADPLNIFAATTRSILVGFYGFNVVFWGAGELAKLSRSGRSERTRADFPCSLQRSSSSSPRLSTSRTNTSKIFGCVSVNPFSSTTSVPLLTSILPSFTT
jgi:hypothetical protein